MKFSSHKKYFTKKMIFAELLLLLFIHTVTSQDSPNKNIVTDKCHTWKTITNYRNCQCEQKSGYIYNTLVKCYVIGNQSVVSLPYCYCMSYNEEVNVSVTGYCVYRCQTTLGVRLPASLHYGVVSNTTISKITDINHDLCSSLEMNREGQMCGRCVKGYAPPVYSYSLACVKCTSGYNWLKYIAVAFTPLTALYFIVIIFRPQVTSGRINGYILTLQILSAPATTRFITRVVLQKDNLKSDTSYIRILTKAFLAMSGVVNLDFFRVLYPPFCIQQNWSTLETLSLEYAIAVYPLLLIICTYLFVKLHDKYYLVVRLWRPLYMCFIKLRTEWNIKASLVEAFATFFLLSYVKILNTSLDLLTPLFLSDQEGDTLKQFYLKTDGTVKYFGMQHLPYAILASVMLFFFNLLPMVLLFLYPCKCFHKCLNTFNVRRQTLLTFVEVFQGCFKFHSRDYRYFAGVYLAIRFLNLITLSVVNGMWYFPVAGIIMFITALIVGTVKPHRTSLHSYIDALMFTCLGVVNTCTISNITIHNYGFSYYQPLYGLMSATAITIIFLYGAILFINAVIPHRMRECLTSLWDKVCNSIRPRNTLTNETNETRPYRLEHEGEYEPLT